MYGQFSISNGLIRGIEGQFTMLNGVVQMIKTPSVNEVKWSSPYNIRSIQFIKYPGLQTKFIM